MHIREIMPAVALRGLTIMPDMIIHFDVSRDRSIRAVENAMAQDQRIFLVTQRKIETEVPGTEDVHHVGCVAIVKQVTKMPDNLVRVLVEGKDRAVLHGFLEEKKEYLLAEVEKC